MGPVEPIVSATTIEGLFVWALHKRITPGLKARIKQVGIDLDRPLHAAYSNDVWNKAVLCVLAELYPNVPPQQSCYDLGLLLMVEGLPSTMIGRAGIQLLRLIGPERTLQRSQRNQRATNNFTTAELKKLGPTHFIIEAGILPEFHDAMRDNPGVLHGPMNHGIYTGLLTILKVKNPRVIYREVDPSKFITEYDMQWEP